MAGEVLQTGLEVTVQGAREAREEMAGLAESTRDVARATGQQAEAATRSAAATVTETRAVTRQNQELSHNLERRARIGLRGIGHLAGGLAAAGVLPEGVREPFGLAAAGIHFGALFGPLGAVLGGIAGAVTGIGAAVHRASERQAEAAERVAKAVEQQSEETIRRQLEQDAEFQSRLADIRLTFVDEFLARAARSEGRF